MKYYVFLILNMFKYQRRFLSVSLALAISICIIYSSGLTCNYIVYFACFLLYFAAFIYAWASSSICSNMAIFSLYHYNFYLQQIPFV